VYYLLLMPRPAHGTVFFPRDEQRKAYDRWFEGVPHGYDLQPGAG
jgi:hypothetical protein